MKLDLTIWKLLTISNLYTFITHLDKPVASIHWVKRAFCSSVFTSSKPWSKNFNSVGSCAYKSVRTRFVTLNNTNYFIWEAQIVRHLFNFQSTKTLIPYCKLTHSGLVHHFLLPVLSQPETFHSSESLSNPHRNFQTLWKKNPHSLTSCRIMDHGT